MTDETVDCFGWCDLHDDTVSEYTYEYKGCWSCYHFGEGNRFPYVSTREAACELKVSESTVRRWLRQGRISGRIFERERNRQDLGALRKLHIDLKSLEGLKKK